MKKNKNTYGIFPRKFLKMIVSITMKKPLKNKLLTWWEKETFKLGSSLETFVVADIPPGFCF